MITKINFPMVNIQNETTIYISQFGQSIALNANMIKIFLILGIVVGFGWKKVVANTYKNKEDSSTGIKEKGEENINIGEENINIGEENINIGEENRKKRRGKRRNKNRNRRRFWNRNRNRNRNRTCTRNSIRNINRNRPRNRISSAE